MRRRLVLAALALTACSRELSVPAPRPLTLTPGTSSVAPRERLVFVAGGGAGGYAYAFSGTPGSGGDATLDAATGAYRAGSTGPGTDVVEVTDAAGATATATVAVGARLAISPQSARVAPGGHATFAAEGGLPPYTFGFQPKGNRSGGAIDAVTGEYTAGPNSGAFDKVQVTDSAGAVAQPESPIDVGPLHLPLPGGASELEVADLNGDGRGDVLSLEPQATATRRVTTTMLLPGGATVTETYFMTYVSGISGLDLTGDGRADLMPGAYNGTSARLYTPDASGHLVVGDTVATAAVPRLPYVLGVSGFTGCTTSGAAGIYRLAWNATAAGFDAATCVTGLSPAQVSHVGDLLAGDFDRSGTTDVAWLERDVYSGPVYGTGTPQLHFSTATQRALAMPAAGWSAVLPSGGPRQQVVAGDFRGLGVTDTAALLVDPSSRNVLKVVPAFTTSAAPAWVSGSLDPFPRGPPALGIARCPALPGESQETLATWNGTLRAAMLSLDATGVATTLSSTSVPSVYVPVTVGACGDVNGDGVPDLALASDSTSTMAVVWGDGDGGFGRRPRFQASSVYATAQVDCDGFGDVVVATDRPSLVTLLGDEHQLARVAETPLSVAPAGIWAGDLGGSRAAGWAGDVVVADTSSNLYAALGSSAGVFGKLTQLRDAPAATGRIPKIVRVAFAELGGAAAGLDLVVLYELSPPGSTPGGPVPGTYELDAIVRPILGSPAVITHQLLSHSGADVQPVDLDGDGVDELVVAQGSASKGAPPYWRALRLRVIPAGSTMAIVGNAEPLWTQANQLPLVAAGRSDDQAVFTSGTRVELVSGVAAEPTFSVATLPGGLSVPYSRTVGNVVFPAAILADVVSPAGTPDLAFAAGGANSVDVHVLPGVTAGGKLAGFGAATTAKAPGVVAGVLRQGLLAPADVLLFTGEEFVPLVWVNGQLR